VVGDLAAPYQPFLFTVTSNLCHSHTFCLFTVWLDMYGQVTYGLNYPFKITSIYIDDIDMTYCTKVLEILRTIERT